MKKIIGMENRLRTALRTNPLYEYAQELVSEGYTEEDVAVALKKVMLVTEPDKVRFQNYVRDLIRYNFLLDKNK